MKNLIVDRFATILREKAEPVSLKDIGSKKIITILKKMHKAMYAEDDGVAIAAPQVGKSLRIFMVKGEILAAIKNDGLERKDEVVNDLVFINPEIIRASKKKRLMEEGCLSVRWLYGKVERSEKIKIRAYDESGKKVEYGASGLLAQIFQHEIDHLEGILFIDKAQDVLDMPPPPKNLKKVKKSKSNE